MLWLWNLHLGVARKWPRGAWCQLADLWHLNHSQSQLSKIIFKKRALTKKNITAGSWKLHSQVSLQTNVARKSPRLLDRSSKIPQILINENISSPNFCQTAYLKAVLGGGFFHILYFQPENWGRCTHFYEHIFQRGWFNHQLDKYIFTSSTYTPEDLHGYPKWWLGKGNSLYHQLVMFGKPWGSPMSPCSRCESSGHRHWRSHVRSLYAVGPGPRGEQSSSGYFFMNFTPRKTNMEPENEPLEEEIPIRNHHFQVPC